MPATVSAIRAGRAAVEIFAEDAKLARGLRGAIRRLRGFASGMAALGGRMVGVSAAMLAPLAVPVKTASRLEEVMNKFNVVFGKQAATMKAWADDTGAQLGRSNRQMAEFVANTQDLLVPMGFAADEAGGLSKQISTLAIDLASFNNLADADVLRDLHAALTGSGEVMKKYGVIVSAAAVKQELLNTAIDPKTATEAQKAQARLAIIMRGTTAAQGDALRSAGSFANQMKALQATVENVSGAIGDALLPYVTAIVTKAREVVAHVYDWAKANRGLIVGFAAVAAGIGAAGAALLGVSVAIKAVSFAMSGVFAIGKGLAVAFSMLTSPIGLVVVALAAAGVAFFRFTETGRQAAAFLSDALAGLVERTRETMGAIGDAMAAGDMQLAAKILWLAIKAEWVRGTNWLKEKWAYWKDGFLALGTEAVYGLAAIFTKAWAGLQSTWVKFTSFLQSTWAKFTTSMADAWEGAEGTVASGIAYIIAKAEGLDPEEVQAQLDADYARRRKKRHDTTAADLKRVARDRAAALAGIDQTKTDALAGLDADRRRAHVARGNKAAAAQRAADAALRKAQAELDAARDQARRGRQADAFEKARANVPSVQMKNQVAAAAAATGVGSTVRGTFNAAAVRGLGAGRSPEVKELKKVAAGVDRLVREAQESNLVFA